jgi:formamidopyrimidine-DNA glycosylase
MDGTLDGNKALAKLGPEPLEIGAAEFAARLKKHKTRMKALLLNQSFVAGIGNIYADEILYAAKVHPLAIAARLSKPRVALVHRAMREVLTLAIEHGGSSISDYVDARGERGWFQIHHNAYGREGQPCPRCGGVIKKILVAQRGTHFCPQCQKR